jgi:hypothetical protein
VIALLVIIAFNQHQQNQQLQIRLESLSSQIDHLMASDDVADAKLDALRSVVSDEPVLSIEDVLAAENATQNDG